jgi:hypothetical protein
VRSWHDTCSWKPLVRSATSLSTKGRAQIDRKKSPRALEVVQARGIPCAALLVVFLAARPSRADTAIAGDLDYAGLRLGVGKVLRPGAFGHLGIGHMAFDWATVGAHAALVF